MKSHSHLALPIRAICRSEALEIDIGPDPAGLRSFAPRLKHKRRCLVAEQSLGSSQSLKDVVAHWTKILGRRADPVCKGGAGKLDTLPGASLEQELSME